MTHIRITNEGVGLSTQLIMRNALTQFEQHKQLRYDVTLRSVSVTIAVVQEQWVLHNLSVHLHHRVYHATRMRHSVICGLSLSTIFSTLSLKRHDFRKKKKLYRTQNVCFDFLYKFCLKHFSFWEEMSEIWWNNVHWFSRKVPGIPVRF